MKNEFVTYDIALALKELGFDQEGFAYYIEGDDDDFLTINRIRSLSDKSFPIVIAPLYQQAFRWFEENYDDAITVRTYKMSNGVRWYDYSVNEFGGRCKDREEAELACLRKIIEIVKENKNV